MLSELLYADDLVLMSETIRGLRNKFLELMEDFQSMGLKDNLGKTKVMINSSIAKDVMSRSKADSTQVCCLRVKANPVLCVQCGKLIHGRCVGVVRMTQNF